MYTISELKKVLILVTAFTIGHSITLALSIFKIISVNTPLIEFLIPVTILITAVSNIISKRQKPKGQSFKYSIALFFGLIVKIKRWDYNFFLSSAIFGISFVMAAERLAGLIS
ncbi:hypothetical protein D3C86_1787500 [compost metagenome]